MVISYLNTDLDLMSPNDLTRLAAALENRGVHSLHVAHGSDGMWRASFEAEKQYTEPDANIADICGAVEGLVSPVADDWWACTGREFNIGYQCGHEPYSFNQELSLATLRRIVEAGAALRITLYRSESAD
jgi:hypothetical protein